jgi:phosphonate utilization associated putative membrane protein
MSSSLTWPVTLAVLFGAFLHAAWNARIKASSDAQLETALMQLIGCAVVLPALLWTGLPDAAAWPFIAASVAVHVAYYFTLTGAYRHGDLGLTYPLMRGCAPLLVAVGGGAVFAEALSMVAWAGLLAVSAGVLALGLSRQALRAPRAVAFALANSAVIALYTVIDGQGVRVAGNALQYVLALFAANGVVNGLILGLQRGPVALRAHARHHAWLALAGALASIGSYGIALWAMTQAPVAIVAALRETSVLFAALLGSWLLKEAFTRRRAIGTALIVGGVMALRIG